MEAKGSEAAGGADAAPLAAPVAAAAPAPSGAYKDSAGSYKRNDLVEYNSTAHKDWLNATVMNADADGRIVIDLKPNTWISKEEQSVKIRPRQAAKVNPVPARACASPMRGQNSPMRQASPGRKAPMVQRSPSAGAFEPNPRRAGTPMGMPQRSPSAGLLDRVPSSPQPPNRGRSADQLLRNASPAPSVPGSYKKSELVEYFSATHRDWLPAVVINVDNEGKICIDLKPNTWLSKDEQSSKIRRRSKAAQEPVPSRPGVPGAASPLRHRSPSAPGSRAGTPRQSPSRGASPAPGGGGPWSRQATPSRAASPRGGAPVAGNGTPRARPPGIPRVNDSPGVRRRSAVGAAGMAIAGA